MIAPDLNHICTSARQVVALAAEYILVEALKFTPDTIQHKGLNDFVSHVDRNSEGILVEGLKNLIPEAGFFTEEDTLNTGLKEWTWIIDPLDGTTNFIHGIPAYCVSVGLLYNHIPVVGIVHEVTSDNCYYAWKGGGAYLNGSLISCSTVGDLSEGLLATGFPYTDFKNTQAYLETLERCLRSSRGVRRIGSAALDLAYVAEGKFVAFFEQGLKPYDVAGGIVMVEEAGGTVSGFYSGDNALFDGRIVASNGPVHGQLIRLISPDFR
ncbi:MAG: inositol monophosphatase [Sphingobacteriales bacterium]|jgi:myo-inositol-1(or 4)-monophosphatase|nr:inositol monophosphatase [Sphingobacteriales bacterium]